MNKIIIYFAIFILCLYQFLIGCGDKTEQSPKAIAVSKKIVQKKSEMIKTPVQSSNVVAEKEIAGKKEIKEDVFVSETTGKQTDPNQKEIIAGGKSEEIQLKASVKELPVDNLNKSVSTSITPDDLARLQPEGITSYNPEGKIDPFEPLFREGTALSGKKSRTPKTPLEMVELSQLRLVAIMRSDSGKNRALVEEASGKGYIVSKGTYVGNNSGRIIKILSDKIIIEEEIENFIGNKKIQERELKLQKPLGEE